MSCMRVILRNSSRNSSGAHTIVFWIICRATRRAATAVLRQALSTRRDSIMPLRLLGVAVQRCVGRVLGVKIIVFPALAAIMLVRCRDLKDFDAGLLHVTQQSCTVRARRLNTDTLERSEGAHPVEHLLVAVPGCRKGPARQHSIKVIDNGRDMKIFVRIDAADDATG